MKKFLLCLLLIGLTAGATVAITTNWETIKGWFTPVQEETVETPEEDNTTGDETQTPDDKTDNSGEDITTGDFGNNTLLSITTGGVTFNVNY